MALEVSKHEAELRAREDEFSSPSASMGEVRPWSSSRSDLTATLSGPFNAQHPTQSFINSEPTDSTYTEPFTEGRLSEDISLGEEEQLRILLERSKIDH